MKHLISEDIKIPEGFQIIGRRKEMEDAFSILMRQKSSSIALVGPGGVGSSTLLMALGASKTEHYVPFDILNKTFHWLDVDGLFSSHGSQEILESFTSINNFLSHTAHNVLIVENARGLIDCARSAGCESILNTLLSSVQNRRYQVIMEVNDNDIGKFFGIHSNIRDFFTVLEIKEPVGSELNDIVKASSEKIHKHHGIRISDEALTAAITLTQKFTSTHPSLARCQPERTINLIDMAMATYRNDCHETISTGDRDALTKLFKERKQATEYLAEMTVQMDQEVARLKEESDGKRPKMSPLEAELNKNIKSADTILKRLEGEYATLADKINAPFKLGVDSITSEFSSKSNIPIEKLNQDERTKVLTLPDRLKKHVFDQDHVVHALSDSIISASAGLKSETKPIAGYLFAGSSGVGKTEIVKALAIEMQGNVNAMVRVDCSEFQEKHSIAKLIGAPPGYEGFSEEAGFLTTAVRRNPHSIILFDEIEKAHPNIFDLLLQVLDDARLTSSFGITAHFNETIVILTTNIGQEHFLNPEMTHEQAEEALMRDLEKNFRPEFLNRFEGRQNIIGFKTLMPETIIKIARREIGKIEKQIALSKPIDLFMSDGDIENMCRDLYSPIAGAREIIGVIGKAVKPSISRMIVSNTLKDKVTIHYNSDKRNIEIN